MENFQSLNNLYDEAHTGVRVGLTRALGSEHLIGGVNYNLEQVNIFNMDTNATTESAQRRRRRVVEPLRRLLTYRHHDQRDAAQSRPANVVEQHADGGRPHLCKDRIVLRLVFSRMARGHVLEVVGRAGVAQKLDSQDVPFYDRYYLGGLRDLRGYDYRAIGPRAMTQDAQRV